MPTKLFARTTTLLIAGLLIGSAGFAARHEDKNHRDAFVTGPVDEGQIAPRGAASIAATALLWCF